jgi:hypothetical protein
MIVNRLFLYIPESPNKKFLETDYPRDRAVEVFRRTDSQGYHFGLRAKNQNFVLCPTRNCEKAIPTLPRQPEAGSPKGRYDRKPCPAGRPEAPR